MSDINGQESISVSFYNSLLGVGSDVAGGSETAPASDQRQVRMPGIGNSYGSTVDRLIDETDSRIGRSAEQEQNLKGLTRRLAEMFEQKQELVSELKGERLKYAKVESERDDLQQQLDLLSADYDQALAQVEQTKAARKRAAQFMEEAKEATRKVISESRMKVADSEEARAEAERAYEDEHNLRRNLEQLLQEMKAEGDAMSDKVTVLSGELKDANRAKDDANRKLAEAEMDLETLRAENEAHMSRIEHLTGRNELLARNLQSINMEHSELRKQFDATAVSHAALSADYEALVHRCSDAEEERDRLRIESIEHSSFSTSEVNALRQELAKARNVIVLLRPIIQKAGAGDLRKGDIRGLDERLTDYERTASRIDGSPDDLLPQQQMGGTTGSTDSSVGTTGYYESQQQSPSQAPTHGDTQYQTSFADDTADTQPDAYGTADDYGVAEIDAMTTADLYAALDLDASDFTDDDGLASDSQGDKSQPVASVSFVDMFGKPQADADGEDAPVAEDDGYDFDEFEDFNDFDDLDEPEEFTDFDDDDGPEATSDANAYEFDISDIYGESEGDFTFPEDLKRSDTQVVESTDSDAFDATDDDDFGLENLSDFNAIMSNFAHYNAEEFGK